MVLCPAEDVLQRRDVDALGVAPLLRLLELLRIAEQHEAPRRLRDGEHVRERHLAGLVDEENVDAPATLREPRATRCRRRREPARRRAGRDIVVVGGLLDDDGGSFLVVTL